MQQPTSSPHWVVVPLLWVACAHATPPAEPLAGDPTLAPLPADPLDAVRGLRAMAGDALGYVDEAFAGGLPLAGDLVTTLAPGPQGCDLELNRQDGYGAIAVAPPAVDDPPEQAAAIEAMIDVLRGAVEVHATCAMISEPEIDEDGEIPGEPYELAVFAVALREDEQTGWRVLGWRRFATDGLGGGRAHRLHGPR